MKKIKSSKSDFITAGLCLLAIIPGLLVYNKLPEQIPIHFDMNGNPDGYSGRLMVVVGFPILMAVFALLGCLMLNLDKRQKNPEKVRKIFRMVFPVILYATQAGILLYALDKIKDITAIELTVFSILIIVIGNYMPKFKPSNIIGLRTSHTLENEELWTITHRFAGRLWFIAGIVLLAFALMKMLIPFLILFALIIIIPVIYSEVMYKKLSTQKSE